MEQTQTKPESAEAAKPKRAASKKRDGTAKAAAKNMKSLDSLHRVTDTLSAMLADEVKGLSARQKAARKDEAADPNTMKGLKEATAVLKDLAAVAKTLNEQGTDAEGAVSGVVLLPPVEKI